MLTATRLIKAFAAAFYGTRRFLYRFDKNPPPVPTLSHMNPVHNCPPYFPKIHSNIILSSTSRSSECYLTFRISDQNFVHISHPTMRAAWPVHLIPLDWINWIQLAGSCDHSNENFDCIIRGYLPDHIRKVLFHGDRQLATPTYEAGTEFYKISYKRLIALK